MVNSTNIRESRDWVEYSDTAALPKEPLVSVLMLAYRHANYLAEAIEGVLIQKTDFPIELVIAEDFSPDQTRAIAVKYQRQYPNLIRLITSDKNVGMNSNFIRAYEECRGKYIALCEGDDYWIDPKKLGKQTEALESHPNIDLAFHSTYSRIFGSSKLSDPLLTPRDNDSILTPAEVISGSGELIPSPSIFIRRAAISRIPIDLMRSAPIVDYVLQVYGALKGGALYTHKPMSVYRRGHPESWSTSMKNPEKQLIFDKSFINLLKWMDRELQHYSSSFTTLIFNRYFPQYVTSIITRNNELKSHLHSILKARVSEYGWRRRIKFYVASSSGPFVLKTIRAVKSSLQGGK